MAPLLTRRLGTKDTNGRLQIVDATLQLGLLNGHCRSARLVSKPLQLSRADGDAEELHREIGDLVRLVEDDGLGAGQKLDEAFLFHRQVRQQQMVVHDDEIGLLRRSPGLDDVAIRISRALLSKTVIGRRSNERPDAGILRHLRQFRDVATVGAMSPLTHRVQVIQQSLSDFGNVVEALEAKIIRPPFEKRRGYGATDCLANQRKIAMIQLILQRFRAGRDNCFSPAQQGR